MKMNTLKIISVTLGLALVVTLTASCSKKSSATTTTYQEVTINPGTVTVSITSTGTLDYSDYENLSFGVDGTVGAVNVKVGDLVKKGQVLATLDADAWNQQLDTLNQAIQTAQRTLTTVQSNLAKAQRQVVTQQLAVSQAQLDIQSAQNNLNNISAVKTAQDAVDTAQANLDTAKASLLAAGAQGDTNGATYLNDYINKSLKPILIQVQQNLQQVLNGTGTSITTSVALQIANAQLQVAQKQNALVGAQAAVDDANTAVTNAQTDEANAEQAVKDAQKNLDDAKAASIEITSPFDGAITAVNISPGVGLSVASSGVIKKGATAIVVADTSKFEAHLLVNEMDMPNISVGMAATIQASALPNVTLPARVTAIFPVATIQSGVVNYAVTATVLSVPSGGSGTTASADPAKAAAAEKALADALAKAVSSGQITQAQAGQLKTRLSSMVGNMTADQVNQLVTTMVQGAASGSTAGQSQFGGNGTTSRSGTGGAFTNGGGQISGQSTGSIPTSFQLRQGLSLTVNLIEQQKQNVLVVPNQAVKTQGSTSTVLVKNSSGVAEQRQVMVGLKDVQNTEIVSGLNAGDTVLIAKTTSTTTTSTSQTNQGIFGIPGLGGLGR